MQKNHLNLLYVWCSSMYLFSTNLYIWVTVGMQLFLILNPIRCNFFVLSRSLYFSLDPSGFRKNYKKINIIKLREDFDYYYYFFIMTIICKIIFCFCNIKRDNIWSKNKSFKYRLNRINYLHKIILCTSY